MDCTPRTLRKASFENTLKQENKCQLVSGCRCCVAGTRHCHRSQPCAGERQRPPTRRIPAPVSGWLIRQRGSLPRSFSGTTCAVHLFLNTKPPESIGVSWGYWERVTQGRASRCRPALATSLASVAGADLRQDALNPSKMALRLPACNGNLFPTCTPPGWGKGECPKAPALTWWADHQELEPAAGLLKEAWRGGRKLQAPLLLLSHVNNLFKAV